MKKNFSIFIIFFFLIFSGLVSPVLTEKLPEIRLTGQFNCKIKYDEIIKNTEGKMDRDNTLKGHSGNWETYKLKYVYESKKNTGNKRYLKLFKESELFPEGFFESASTGYVYFVNREKREQPSFIKFEDAILYKDKIESRSIQASSDTKQAPYHNTKISPKLQLTTRYLLPHNR